MTGAPAHKALKARSTLGLEMFGPAPKGHRDGDPMPENWRAFHHSLVCRLLAGEWPGAWRDRLAAFVTSRVTDRTPRSLRWFGVFIAVIAGSCVVALIAVCEMALIRLAEGR